MNAALSCQPRGIAINRQRRAIYTEAHASSAKSESQACLRRNF